MQVEQSQSLLLQRHPTFVNMEMTLFQSSGNIAVKKF